MCMCVCAPCPSPCVDSNLRSPSDFTKLSLRAHSCLQRHAVIQRTATRAGLGGRMVAGLTDELEELMMDNGWLGRCIGGCL